jgi:hypothetical protein
MKNRIMIILGLGLSLLAGAAFPQEKKAAQELRKMKVSALKPAQVGITPSPDSTVLIVKSSIPNLLLESNVFERVKKVGEGVWYLYLLPEPQKISFNAAGYEQVTQEYKTFEGNRSYEVKVVPKKGGKTLWWVLGGAAAAGGAFVALSGGGTPPPQPLEKLPDPPGSPTGN